MRLWKKVSNLSLRQERNARLNKQIKQNQLQKHGHPLQEPLVTEKHDNISSVWLPPEAGSF